MSYSLLIHPKATNELENATLWYEKRSEGLGRRFFTAVNKRIIEIMHYPTRYPIKHKDYREVGITIFPFVIVYQVFENDHIVFITYIFHNKKNPKKKYLR